MKTPEIPKNNCDGCKDRDAMIEKLSRRIDELEKESDTTAEKEAA